ncbi:DUF480 domain-containing protein [Zavarzinella formosa]|uniref:DUF480 domain-containing protein n=1 Tax=Zavarzinella formosa TaxID=360055 RepID=UPI0012F901BB|nr:DUF480 domain-containing protein [Zavarzinella formosa]
MERRILGVLVEKAMTAATSEPLTLNAVVVGSNQKSNRDPLVNYEEPEVDEALTQLARKGLVFRQTGGRTDRWRHNLYDAWKLTKPEVALMAELLLRGPQTAAEARTRASRMETVDSEELPEFLRNLVERGMVVWITPEARRGAILTHGFHTPNELHAIRQRHPVSGLAPEPETPPPTPRTVTAPVAEIVKPDPRLDEAIAQIAQLRETVNRLEKQLVDLHANLGVPLAGS